MTTSRAVLEKEGVRFDFHDYVPRINEAPYETPVYLVPSARSHRSEWVSRACPDDPADHQRDTRRDRPAHSRDAGEGET